MILDHKLHSWLRSRLRKEIPNKIALEYTLDAERHERNVAFDSEIEAWVDFE